MEKKIINDYHIYMFLWLNGFLYFIIYCGYLEPRPSTPSQSAQPNLRAPKGKGPEANRLRNARSTLRLGTLRGLGPDTNRPRNARPILRPGARVSHIPNAFSNLSAYFPDRQLYQTKLPTSSPHYKREFTHELTLSPLTE